MKTKIILISLTMASLLSKVSGQSQADCNNLYLDTVTFYITPHEDSVVSGNLFYNDNTFINYPALRLILADTSIITPYNDMIFTWLDSGSVKPFIFGVNFKTLTFSDNTIVNGLFHIYASGSPGDSIVTCYFPMTIILQNPTGISESGIKGETFQIYPNPTDKSATLEFDNPKNANCTLILYDTHGRPVQTITEITTNKVEIERKQLSNGLYFFKLHTDRQIIANGKLIIE